MSHYLAVIDILYSELLMTRKVFFELFIAESTKSEVFNLARKHRKTTTTTNYDDNRTMLLRLEHFNYVCSCNSRHFFGLEAYADTQFPMGSNVVCSAALDQLVDRPISYIRSSF